MWDCWMSSTWPMHPAGTGRRRTRAALDRRGTPPDDYWGYAELRRRMPARMLLTTGEHEANPVGVPAAAEMGCADIIQPDVGWCGGMTELLKISALRRPR